MKSQKPIIICGATASGKSALAIQLAQELSKNNDTVIINADSQQVYKEIPILSAQPSEEEKKLVPHFLFGEIYGNEEFNVAIWLKKVLELLKKYPNTIIVGGTGMYIDALLHGISEIPDIPDNIREKVRSMDQAKLREILGEHGDGNTNRMRRNLEVKLTTGKYISEFHEIDNNHTYQPQDFIILNLNVSRETIYSNINKRFVKMMENGAVEEVQELLKKDYPANLSVMKAVGVREIADYLADNVSRETAIEKAQQKSRNYAKRQLTWLRNQLPDHKIDVENFEQALKVIT